MPNEISDYDWALLVGRIRKCLREKGLSQTRFGQLVGICPHCKEHLYNVPFPTISRWLNGHFKPSGIHVASIEAFLEVAENAGREN